MIDKEGFADAVKQGWKSLNHHVEGEFNQMIILQKTRG